MKTPATVGELCRQVKRFCGLHVALTIEGQFIHGRRVIASLGERLSQPFIEFPDLSPEMTVEQAEAEFGRVWGIPVEILAEGSGTGGTAKRRARNSATLRSVGFVDGRSLGDWGCFANSGAKPLPPAPPYGVFISYRRPEGSPLAQLLCQFLEDRGFRTFLDVASLAAGQSWPDRIREELDRTHYLLLVCTPGVFDRCVLEADWVRREVAYALRSGRRIVPVVVDGFRLPGESELPREMQKLLEFQQFEYRHEEWRRSRDILASQLDPGYGTARAERQPSGASFVPATNGVERAGNA